MKKRIRAAILAAAIAWTLILPCASARTMPSLFCNDEAWYKDSIEPLVVRDSTVYIPAELCATFENIMVSVEDGNNVLIWNTETGSYVSILFREQSAAVNGTIVDNIGILQDAGVFYVEAAPVCEAMGLKTEQARTDDGSLVFRVTDENRQLTFNQLMNSYSSQNEDYRRSGSDTSSRMEDGTYPLLYLLCYYDRGWGYSAREVLDLADLHYTVFLTGEESVGEIWRANAHGEIGLFLPEDEEGLPDLAALKANAARLKEITRRTVHFVLCGEEDSDAVREAGYMPVVPDLWVQGGDLPWERIAAIENVLAERSRACVFMEDCWCSQEMASLIPEASLPKTANLTER